MTMRNARGVVCLATIATAVLAAAPDARADEATLEVGQRVRLLGTGSDLWLTGRLVDRTADRLLIETELRKDPVAVPYGEIRSLQVSAGKDEGRGALFGAVVGLALGSFVYAVTPAECSGDGCLQIYFLVAAPATAIGALTGAIVAPEHWREVDRGAPAAALRLSDRLRVGVGPVRDGGVRLAASILF